MRACFAVCLATAVFSTSAVTIVNPGFELPAISNNDFLHINGTDHPVPLDFGWTLVSGNIELVRDFWMSAEGNQSIDLNGEVAGAISQDIFVDQGWYRLSFFLSANPGIGDNPADLQVSLGSVFSSKFTYQGHHNTTANMDWLLVVSDPFYVPASADYALSFSSLTAGNHGPAVDLISLNAAVPEPMGGTGAIALAAVAAGPALWRSVRRRA